MKEEIDKMIDDVMDRINPNDPWLIYFLERQRKRRNIEKQRKSKHKELELEDITNDGSVITTFVWRPGTLTDDFDNNINYISDISDSLDDDTSLQIAEYHTRKDAIVGHNLLVKFYNQFNSLSGENLKGTYSILKKWWVE